MTLNRSAHKRDRVLWERVEATPDQFITEVRLAIARLARPPGCTQEEVYAFSGRRGVVGDTDDLQVGWVNLHPYLFSTFADGCLSDRFAGLKVPPDQAVVPIFEPSVEPSQQQDRIGSQQKGMNSD
jgi:hypothetical protein